MSGQRTLFLVGSRKFLAIKISAYTVLNKNTQFQHPEHVNPTSFYTVQVIAQISFRLALWLNFFAELCNSQYYLPPER